MQKRRRTMGGGERVFRLCPVHVQHGVFGHTAEVCVWLDHPPEHLLCAFGHLPRADPLAAELETPYLFSKILNPTLSLFIGKRSRTVRPQYFSRSSLVVNCSPSAFSKGVRPMRISKNVTPSDQTSDLRVSCGNPRARSGDRY